jgi:hypothetical protein
MREEFLAFALLALTAIGSQAQLAPPAIWQIHQAPDQDGVYYVGPEVTAPVLVKTVYVPYANATAKESHDRAGNGD